MLVLDKIDFVWLILSVFGIGVVSLGVVSELIVEDEIFLCFFMYLKRFFNVESDWVMD